MIVMSTHYFYFMVSMIIISIFLAGFSILSIAYPLELELKGEIINNGTAFKVTNQDCYPLVLNSQTKLTDKFRGTCHTF